MSGRIDILGLASTLGLSSLDPIMLDRYYTEALIALGQTDVQLDARFIPVTAGEPRDLVSATAPDVVHIGAAFFGTREITESTQAGIKALDEVVKEAQSSTTKERAPELFQHFVQLDYHQLLQRILHHALTSQHSL